MYLSDLVGLPVRDRDGLPLARLQDVIVRADFSEAYPAATGIVARLRRRRFFVPWEQVADVAMEGIRLASARVSLAPFQRREGEVLLARDVMDKQLVDVEGRRVVRANDLQFALRDGRLRIVAVDVSPRAIVRRLLPRALRGRTETGKRIDWADVEVFGGQLPTVKLKVSHARLAQLPPIEIARIVDSLSVPQGAELVDALDVETAADTLEELSPERQADILEGMDEERAADILEEMEPDDAADVLGDLPEEKADSLLRRMDPEQADDVRDLMQYEEDTAGGIMTTELVVIPVHLQVGAAVRYIREELEVPAFVPYVYVVDTVEDHHLVGVLSLRDMLVAPPDAAVADVMDGELMMVEPDEHADTVARTIADYDLLALPVVDGERRLLGVVTVDDAMDLLLPDGWKRRLPRVFG